MIDKLNEIKPYIGNTPLQKCHFQGLDFYAKLEYFNFSGSVKDRAAYNILYNALTEGKINSKSVIIESSSGNLAIALSLLCRKLGLSFIAVIDKNTNSTYENLLKIMATKVIKVQKPDSTGGYLFSRIKMVKQLCSKSHNMFWTNQYENPDNYLAYYNTLGSEICDAFTKLDYVFVSVSSGGTITGISLRLKEKFENVKIIAVDVEGSLIFQSVPSQRYISGIGSSMRPSIIDKAVIDDVVHVSQKNMSYAAHDLLREQSLCKFS